MTFFGVLKFEVINDPIGLCIIGFATRNLASPTTDPIGLYYVHGDRRYMWRDRVWAEYDLPYRDLRASVSEQIRNSRDPKETAGYLRLMDAINCYQFSSAPTVNDVVDNPASNDKSFWRCIYLVNDEPFPATSA